MSRDQIFNLGVSNAEPFVDIGQLTNRPVAFLTVIERLQRVFREGGEALDVLDVRKMPKPKDI